MGYSRKKYNINHFPDVPNGCPLADAEIGGKSSCLQCPFADCILGQEQRIMKAKRNEYICNLFKEKGKTVAELRELFGLSRTAIQRIVYKGK